jgi:ABC-type sugar transport system substrate-binding protein
MTSMRFITLAVSAAIAVAACAGPAAPSPAATGSPTAPTAPAGTAPAGSPAGDITILVNMKGPGGGNPFWAAVEEGALAAGQELGVTVNVMAPPAESDVAAQLAQVEDAITQGVDGIALAPTDPEALAPVVDQAIDAGIPVVFIDTKGSNEGVTFIGTDNEAGAALAGQYLCENVPEGGKVAILQGLITQSTGKARADGAKAAVEGCGLNLVAETPAEWDRAKGLTATEDILTQHADLAGLFGSNDNMALGATEAIANAGIDPEAIVVVGFDANPDAAQAVLDGTMDATVAQNPTNMGRFGVENLLKLINGETIPEVIDTGTELVTAENAADYTD